MKRTSLTEKMVLYFLALGIGSIVVTGLFSYFSARRALLDRTYDQLTSIRLARAAQVENYFTDRLHETKAYASSSEIIKFVSLLSAGRHNQADNAFVPAGYLFPDPGYFSGFAILDTAGNILYKNDPLSAISISKLEIRGHSSGSQDDNQFMVDYQHSGKSGVKQIIAVSAINSKGSTSAYLALIVRTERINDFMLEIGPSRGLGYSGETYLVGPDHLMRSQSRFIPESIMKIPVGTLPVEMALEGQSGTLQVQDYRGVEVLSSYGQVRIKGLKWIILAEIDYQEVTSAVLPIRNNILLLTVITGIAFFIISFIISRSITKPLKKLMDAAIDLGEGKTVSMVKIEADDEIGALTDAFNRMAVNVYEKDQALKNEKYNRLRSAIDGQDQERQRLSREMHDGIGQSMIAVRLRLGALENKVPEKIRLELQTIIAMTDNLIDEVRAISNALMPPALAEFGLTAAIRNLCNNLTGTYGIETTFEGDIPGQLLGKKARLYIFRIFQEALNNVSKHSGATNLKIETRMKDNLLFISIADNGKGIDPESSCSPKGHGLNNIKERAGLLRGQATIESSAESGTTIKIEIPLNKNNL